MEAPKTPASEEQRTSVQEVLEKISREVDPDGGNEDNYDPEIDEKLADALALKTKLDTTTNKVRVYTPEELERELAERVSKETDFPGTLKKWVAQSQAFYEREAEEESQLHKLVVKSNPQTEADWKEVCEKMFGEQVNAVKEKDLLFARPNASLNTAHVKSQDHAWRNLFAWLSRSEQFMLRGMRAPDWIDPAYDELFQRRQFEYVSSVGVGYDYAVILGCPMRPEKKESKTCTFYVAHLSAAGNSRMANYRNAQENIEILGSDNNKAKAELRKTPVSAYLKSSAGFFLRPDHADIHGNRVSAVWTNVSCEGNENKKQDMLRIYKLPRLQNNEKDMTTLMFPVGVISHYEIHWPYMVFSCSNQYLFDIEWVARLLNIEHFKSIREVEGSVDLIVVVDLQAMSMERVWDVPGEVSFISLYPPKNSVLCESVPLDQVKVLWSCEDASKPDSPHHRAQFEDYMLRRKDPTDIEVNHLWRRAEDELELKRSKNITYKSPPNEPPSAIHRYHGGHTVMISANNFTTLIKKSMPMFPSNEIYFGRDNLIVNRAIYNNVCVTMYPDYALGFGCTRAPEAKKALQVVSRFTLKELEDWGEASGKVRPNPTVRQYKSLWMNTERIAAQFQDGTLVFLTAMSEKEVIRLKEVITGARKNKATKEQLKEMVERKVHTAADEQMKKKQLQDLAVKSPKSEKNPDRKDMEH